MTLDRLAVCDVEMLRLDCRERDTVVSCIQAAIVELAIVMRDRAKAGIEVNSLIASLVIR